MIAYVDTSFLAKRYLLEEATDKVNNILEDVHHLESSVFLKLELVSLLERVRKEKRINSAQYRQIHQEINVDIQKGFPNLNTIEEKIIEQAEQLIQCHLLRAPDAIHLATALFSQKRIKKDLKFLSADNRLIQAAKLEGLSCINPLE